MGRGLDKKLTFIKRMFHADFYSHRAYIRMYDRLKIDENMILLESQHGTSLGGNIAAILKTLCEEEEFSKLRIYVTVRKDMKEKLSSQWQAFKNSAKVRPLVFDSKEYFKVLASAGYLINDNTFTPMFMKKPGQLYLNTWHGTPLKTLGKGIKGERFAIGNAQRNFLSADLMLYPNEHTRDVIQRDYMIDNFGTGRMAMTGYPRNEVFFDDKLREEVRERFGFGNTKVYAYLPTWRGIVGKVDKEVQDRALRETFDVLDKKLDNDTAVFVKLHPMLRGSMKLDGYKHIKTFPENLPSYDFLQATDGLITDFSSIMFDYAPTGRKIILYTYDEEDYIRDRGLTFSLDEVPFPRVHDANALADEIAADKAYDDTKFLERFCKWDRPGVTKELLHNFIRKDLGMYPKMPDNGKKNVVVYGGDFIRNGIATALGSLMNSIDPDKYNYLVLYKLSPRTNNQKGYHEPALDDIPEDIATLGLTNPHCGTWKELVWTKTWKRLQRLMPWLPFRSAKRDYESIARREAVKSFGMARIDALVQFNGYFPDVIEMFKVMDCGRAIFVHNDMNGENKKSFAVPRKLLADAYEQYDEVAVVTEELKPRMDEFQKAAGRNTRKYTTVLNIINYHSVLDRANGELKFDEATETDITIDELKTILTGDDIKLINIGRFSPEKGHLRLIDAFEKAAAGNDRARLIILGSYGVDYLKVVERAKKSPLADRITIIKFMSNPFPLLKACDYFVLSSIYEGFGLVLCEADILGKPCFSPRITGPTAFMEKYGGMLVEDSTEAIAEGIKKCLEGKVKRTLKVDYEGYNAEAVKQFEDMVERLVHI